MNDKHHEHHHKHHHKHDDDDKDQSNPPPTPPPAPAAPDPRPGFVWVDQKDGVPAHWERERASAGQSQPDDTAASATAAANAAGTGPVVRDHRSDQPPVVPTQDSGPTVRDHRTDASGNPAGGVSSGGPAGGPTVRDHRGAQQPVAPPTQDTGPTIRDHRDQPFVPPPPQQDTGPTVRDHRGDQPPAAQQADPNVRDHRGGDQGNPSDIGVNSLDDLVAAGQVQAADFLSSGETGLDDLPAQPVVPAGVDVRDHREPAPAAEVRDHRGADDLNITGDVSLDDASAVPDLLGDDAFDASFDSGLIDAPAALDDWETPVSVADHDTAADIAAFSLDDTTLSGGDDAFGSDDSQLFTPLDTDTYASDVDAPEHADAID